MNVTDCPVPQKLAFGAVRQFNGLSELPIFAESPERPLVYLTLDQALQEKVVQIGETSESGSVPELLVKNLSTRPVFLMDGEELVGAKQNRVLNLSIMVPAMHNTIIPVSCVESGRWNFNRGDFAGSDRVHFSRGRANKMASVSESMSLYGMKRSNQGEVWSEIDAKFRRMNQASPTSAMSDLFDRSNEDLGAYVDALPPLEGQVGAFYFVHDTPIGFDLFDQAKTFELMRAKLVRSYAIDAMEPKPLEPRKLDPEQIPRIIESMRAETWQRHPGTGLGEDYRLTAKNLVGAGLVVDDTTIHLSGFLVSPVSKNSVRSGMAPARIRRRIRHH